MAYFEVLVAKFVMLPFALLFYPTRYLEFVISVSLGRRIGEDRHQFSVLHLVMNDRGGGMRRSTLGFHYRRPAALFLDSDGRCILWTGASRQSPGDGFNNGGPMGFEPVH